MRGQLHHQQLITYVFQTSSPHANPWILGSLLVTSLSRVLFAELVDSPYLYSSRVSRQWLSALSSVRSIMKFGKQTGTKLMFQMMLLIEYCQKNCRRSLGKCNIFPVAMPAFSVKQQGSQTPFQCHPPLVSSGCTRASLMYSSILSPKPF